MRSINWFDVFRYVVVLLIALVGIPTMLYGNDDTEGS